MLIDELKCIEVLIRYLSKKSNLTQEIYSEFDDIEHFENIKPNLFNLISIHDLIDNFSLEQPFSLEYFLKTGIIPGLYDDKTFTPDEDYKFNYDYKDFYLNLIEALKEGNYLFDEANNIFVSSEKLETVVPQIWLYRLSQACKRNKYERLYFYNKKKENNITDKTSLIDYIRHTKTFLVELSSNNPNINYDLEFSSTEARTNSFLKNNREVKVEDIIQTFEAELSSECTSHIKKYKLSDAFFLVSKAEKMGREFYSEPLHIQQKYLNKWMVEYINSNEISKNETQKFILLANHKNKHNLELSKINKKDVIIGLFNLYIKIIGTMDFDFESISLVDFKIEEYVSDETQQDLTELKKIIKLINSYGDSKSQIAQKLEEIRVEIAELDQIKDKKELKAKKAEREELIKKYRSEEDIEDELGYTRNILQEKIRQAKQNSIESIAFDNDLIINLLLECIKHGRIFFEPNSNKVVFETQNDILGKVIFKTTINLDKILLFIENNNYRISEYTNTNMRWA